MKLKFKKEWNGTLTLTINDKVHCFVGTLSGWGLGIEINAFGERSVAIQLIKWYVGLEIWYSE